MLYIQSTKAILQQETRFNNTAQNSRDGLMALTSILCIVLVDHLHKIG